ncbi:MAG: putative transporter substrate binding protein [Paenibacillus sp.]|jgi:multiple sugar transport system substrate-binding protein|nr:putative transporter substrate binding protein [Paenibacillus sp.]
MKKWLSVVMVGLMMALSACSGGVADTGNSSAGNAGKEKMGGNESASAKPVTIRYGLWNKDQEPAMKEIAKKFQETHPNITVLVEVTPFDQYWQKLQAAASASDGMPDVFWMNGPNFAKYASNGILQPISEQIKKDGIDVNNYPKSLVDLYSLNGTNYGIPKDYDTIGLWYNKKMFDDAGLKYPDETWDWNKLTEAAKKLTDPAKGIYGFGAQMINQEGFYNTILSNGGFVISPDMKTSGYDKPEAIEALKFWTDMISVHKASPTQAQMVETPALTMFQSGKMAMMFGGSWRQIAFSKNEYAKDKVDVALLPKGKERVGVIHGLANVMFAKTTHPKEAWQFLKFLGSKEAAEIQAKTGAVIPAFKGTQEIWVKSNTNFKLQNFIEMEKYSKPYPVSKDTSKWQDLEKTQLTKAWFGEAKIEDAAKAVAKQMNEFLSKE